MTRSDFPFQRLYNQRLSTAPYQQPGEVVTWLGAVQSQDYAGAKWALGMRMQSATESAIDQAFADGSILRTHVLRPTWHFVTPADIRWLLTLTAPRVHAQNATMYRRLELEAAIFARSQRVIARALQGGSLMTRDELGEVLQKDGIPLGDRLRLTYIVMAAELEGIICSGPRRKKQFTYALLDERAPQARSMDRQDALVELSRRYFMSRGPATPQDFAKWSGLMIADARNGLEAVKAQLNSETVDGREYWFPQNALPETTGSPSAYLLSIYDEYISSYKDHSAIAVGAIAAQLKALENLLTSIIVVDGQIVGTWKRILRKDAVVITTQLYTELSPPAVQAITAAAQRFAQYHGLPLIFSDII